MLDTDEPLEVHQDNLSIILEYYVEYTSKLTI